MSRRKTPHVSRKHLPDAQPVFYVCDSNTPERNDNQPASKQSIEQHSTDQELPDSKSTASTSAARRSRRSRVTPNRFADYLTTPPTRSRSKAINDDDSSERDADDDGAMTNDTETDYELDVDEKAAMDFVKLMAKSTPFEEQSDVAGENVFGFLKTEESDSMATLVQTCASPKTSPETANQYDDFGGDTDSDDYVPSYNGTDNGDDDETEDEDADNRRTVQERIPSPKHSIGKCSNIRSAKHWVGATKMNKPAPEYIPQCDNYFSTAPRAATSNKALGKISAELINLSEAQSMQSNAHAPAIKKLFEMHTKQFARWMFMMHEGFNVLLYGLGSKRTLLQEFHRQHLMNKSVVVVNGFFPALTIKDVLDSLGNELMGLKIASANSHDMIDAIKHELQSQPAMHIFLLVNNIDGEGMRNHRMQTMLCNLASIPNVHLVATVDHTSSLLMWDTSQLSRFQFCWIDVTTMLPYCTETAFENSLLVQNSGGPALFSMRSVFASLTKNARGIFMAIVQHQLKKGGPDAQNYTGMLLKNLYWICREAFLVSNDVALRVQLTEFIDHKLLRMKRTADGAETLLIPYEHGLLKCFADEVKSTM